MTSGSRLRRLEAALKPKPAKSFEVIYVADEEEYARLVAEEERLGTRPRRPRKVLIGVRESDP